MYIGQENSKILEHGFYAWVFYDLISFLDSSEGNSLDNVIESKQIWNKKKHNDGDKI